MRRLPALTSTATLLLALSACGGPGGGSGETSADDAAETSTAAAPGAAGATPAPSASASASAAAPTATPSPAASASAAPAPSPPPVALPVQPAKFATCGVCHSTVAGQNGIGPSLAGVFGRRSGTVAGANYSPAMRSANVTWNEANLRRYLLDPAAVVPGGLMPPPGLTPAEAQAMVNYLKTL